MITVLKRIWQRYFSDEQAVMLGLFASGLAVFLLLTSSVLTPVFAALILAYLLQGLVSRLEKLSIPHTLAVSIATLLLLICMLLALLVIMPLVWQQLAALFKELPNLLDSLRVVVRRVSETFQIGGGEDQLEFWLRSLGSQLGEVGGNLLSRSVATLISVAQLVVYIFLMPMLVFFLLKDSRLFMVSISRLLPRKRELMKSIWHNMDRQMAKYVRGKALEIVLVALVSFAVFSIFGLRYSVLLAILTGLSVLVPYVGAFVVTAPILLVAYAQWGFSESFMYLSLAYLVIQIIDGNILVPLLFSEAVSLHPASIIVAVLFFGGIWGFWGIFFAIPLATLVKTIFTVWPRKAN